MLVPSFLVTTLLALEGAEAIAYWLPAWSWILKMWLVWLLVPKQEEDHFPSGIAGIVELINCTWKLNWMQTIRGGGAKISWAQGRKVPKYGPAHMSLVQLAQGACKNNT